MAEFFQKINWIDLLVVILLIRSSYVGFTRGLSWEFFRVLGIISAAFIAVYFYEPLAQLLCDYLPVLFPFSNLISFTGIYLIILFISKLINVIIEKIIKVEVFSALERIGGLVFGFLRGGVLLSLILLTLIFTPLPYFEKCINERAYTGRTVLKVVPVLYEKAASLFQGLKYANKNAELLEMVGLKDI